MKTIMKIFLAAVLLALVSPVVKGQTASPVKVACNELTQKGDSVRIDAVITVRSELIESRKSLTLTPVLESASQKMGLPSVLLNGKNRQKVYQREIALGNLQDEPRYVVIKAHDQPEVSVPYVLSVPFEPWMKEARFVLAQDLCGCGNEEMVPPLVIADKIRMRPDHRYEVNPILAYITPEAETEKHRAEVGTAYLDFPVGKSVILKDFRNNALELDKINGTVNTVLNDPNITPKGIYLKGYASPEGSYASNARLAENRVKALRDYMNNEYQFKPGFFTLDFEPEDWDGLKTKVEADMEVPARDEVLAIIGNDEVPDRKEAQLKALKGGAAYRYVLNVIFPSLRHTDYRIDYSVRFFTVEEGREIIKIRPQQLSLSEMFAVANSYKVGSPEYNEVFDIAVRMYSDDPVANLNAANIALSKKELETARKYLAKAGDSPEAIHARGVWNLLNGNLQEAESLLLQAKTAGIREAEVNLNELYKKKADNELFDSFN